MTAVDDAAKDASEDAGGEGPDAGLLVLLTLAVLGLLIVLAIGGQLLDPGGAGGSPVAARVSLAAAFVGGLLAFLSPCSVAVVPGFFAYAFDTRGDLLRHTYVFFLGLALVFVPLGFGASVVGEALRVHQTLLVQASGWAMVAIGVVLLAGWDPFARLGAWAGRLTDRGLSRARTETGRTFVLGAVFGLATTSCTAPILAGIAVLSVGAGLAPVQSMVLFLVFALGIAAPLFALAWAGDRTAFLDRLKSGRWTLSVGGREVRLSASKVLAGVTFILLGLLFVATDGTRELVGLYDAVGATELYERLDLAAQRALGGLVGWVLGLAGVAAAGGLWWWRRRRRRRQGPGGSGDDG